jgi:hypothetical protein
LRNTPPSPSIGHSPASRVGDQARLGGELPVDLRERVLDRMVEGVGGRRYAQQRGTGSPPGLAARRASSRPELRRRLRHVNARVATQALAPRV